MLFPHTIHHASRAINTLPENNQIATQHIAQAVAFTFAFIGLISAIVFFRAVYKDRREEKEWRKKNNL